MNRRSLLGLLAATPLLRVLPAAKPLPTGDYFDEATGVRHLYAGVHRNVTMVNQTVRIHGPVTFAGRMEIINSRATMAKGAHIWLGNDCTGKMMNCVFTVDA